MTRFGMGAGLRHNRGEQCNARGSGSLDLSQQGHPLPGLIPRAPLRVSLAHELFDHPNRGRQLIEADEVAFVRVFVLHESR
jgi:hypothetical protein